MPVPEGRNRTLAKEEEQMHHLAIAGLLVLPSAALPAQGSQIQVADATRAIVAAHPELAGAPVELPAAILTREAAPSLEAGPVEHWPASAASLGRIRMRCADDTICRPFYATVHLAAAQAQTAPEPGKGAAAHTSAVVPTPSDMLHPGAHASLVIDSGRIHLRIPVTCLGSGAPGAPIRVAGPKNARIYQATVVDGATVRGVL